MALANTVVVVSAYLAVAALVWGLADATMPPPRDLPGFSEPTPGARTWRIAHLSDVHVVGERYGFRIESGRSGPQGDERFRRLLRQLEDIHASAPLDAVLISGDATDAGRSGEWAEFLDALAAHPDIAARVLDAARQSRRQHRRSRQSGAARSVHRPQQPAAQDPHSVRHQRDAGITRARGGPGWKAYRQDSSRTRCGRTPPSWRDLPRAGRPYFSTSASDRWDDVLPDGAAAGCARMAWVSSS